MSTSTSPTPDQPATSGKTTNVAVDLDVAAAEPLTTDEREALLSQIGSSWWLVLALGIVSLLAGAFVLWQPFTTVRVAAVVFGLWLLISGIFQLAQSFNHRLETTARVLSAISGVLGIILGIICFDSVEDRISLLTLFIGLWWILRGLVNLMVGAGNKNHAANGFSIFLGILGIIAGIVVLIWPIASLSVLVVMVGIWLVALGIIEIVASFMVRSRVKKAQAVMAAA